MVFFSCLAGFFAIHMHFFLATINEQNPYYMLDESLIGTNPGMGFYPFPYDNDEVATIHLKSKDKETANRFTAYMNENLKGYYNLSQLENKGKNQVECDFDNLPPPGKACKVQIKNWSPCTKEDNYGYNKNSPCILLKLNRVS